MHYDPKKTWENDYTTNCRVVIEEGTEAPCTPCTGTYGKCAKVDGTDYAVSKFTITNEGDYDYCPAEIKNSISKRTCKKCKAKLSECDRLTGIKTYTGFTDDDYDYTENATSEYWCPPEEMNLVGTTVDDECEICILDSGDSKCRVDNNTGKFFKTPIIKNLGSYDYCPQNLLDLAETGEECQIPNEMLGLFTFELKFNAKTNISLWEEWCDVQCNSVTTCPYNTGGWNYCSSSSTSWCNRNGYTISEPRFRKWNQGDTPWWCKPSYRWELQSTPKSYDFTFRGGVLKFKVNSKEKRRPDGDDVGLHRDGNVGIRRHPNKRPKTNQIQGK